MKNKFNDSMHAELEAQHIHFPPSSAHRRYFIDMDGVLFRFDNMIESMDVLYEEGYFRDLPVQEKVMDAVRALTQDEDCFILSHVLDSRYAAAEKKEAIHRHLPALDDTRIILVPYGENKHDYIPDGIMCTDILLDDYTKNLIKWVAAGGYGIKLLNGINDSHMTWKGQRIHHNSDTILQALEEGQSQEQDITDMCMSSSDDDMRIRVRI